MEATTGHRILAAIMSYQFGTGMDYAFKHYLKAHGEIPWFGRR